MSPVASGSSRTAPARLEALEAGLRIPTDQEPPGWTHLVSKSIPKLETGDLDTVSEQAHVIAARIRPVIAAEIAKAPDAADSSYHLVRVGMGLCAPAVTEGDDVVVTSSKVEGTRGEWTTKERIILTAMAYETSKATLVAATPTFALVKTPVNSLVSGKHRTPRLLSTPFSPILGRAIFTQSSGRIRPPPRATRPVRSSPGS